MTMYHEMTTKQKLGLTDEGMAVLKTESLAKLTELGFTELPKVDWTATCEAIDEQISNDPEIANRVFDVVFDKYACDGIHTDNYEEFEERWVEEQADTLHG